MIEIYNPKNVVYICITSYTLLLISTIKSKPNKPQQQQQSRNKKHLSKYTLQTPIAVLIHQPCSNRDSEYTSHYGLFTLYIYLFPFIDDDIINCGVYPIFSTGTQSEKRMQVCVGGLNIMYHCIII